MTPVELETQSNADILKDMKDALEAKLDAYNQDHKLTEEGRETNVKTIHRKLNFINNKM